MRRPGHSSFDSALMKKTIYNVQILRLIASAMVLFGHVQHEAGEMPYLDLANYTPWVPVYFAGGVDIFFVISGFIMYLLSKEQFGKPGASANFLWRRIARVAPPYWLFTTAMIGSAIVFASYVTHSTLDPLHVIGSYFFVPVQNPYGRYFPVLILGWTLNFEMLFYALLGIALLFNRRAGVAFLFGSIALLGTLGIVAPPGSTSFAFWCNPIIFEFLFGIALAHFRLAGMRIALPAGIALVVAGVAVMVLMQSMGIAAHFWDYRPLWMGLPALAICSGFALVDEAPEPGPVKRALVFGGDVSFVLYLSHPFALTLVSMLWKKAHLTHAWGYVVVANLFSVVVACVLHVLIEKPATTSINRFVSRRLAPRRVVAAAG